MQHNPQNSDVRKVCPGSRALTDVTLKPRKVRACSASQPQPIPLNKPNLSRAEVTPIRAVELVDTAVCALKATLRS